jgi:hypothetical protein
LCLKWLTAAKLFLKQTTYGTKRRVPVIIPKSASNGSAQADLNIYTGNYQNRNIPAAENKTFYISIGTTTKTQPPPSTTPTSPTPTPEPHIENLIDWLP